MIKDLGLHGSIGPVDFFAFVIGVSTYNTYFFEEGSSSIRFFSRGNEFTISEDNISYRGIGGSFCEYMFGVEKPVKDLTKSDISNRLIMFGAFLDDNEQVVFTNETDGSETFYKLFLMGHAVRNYYFIVSSEFKDDYRKRQKDVLMSVGKFLKRTDLLRDEKDSEMISSFFSELNEQNSILFIFKLINRGNQEYYNAFKNLYSKNRELNPHEELYLEEIALRNKIDSYQQERMKIDIMYRHAENRVVVDEYRDILIRGLMKDVIGASEHAKLSRLRTLSIRNDIPIVLFDKLDELLMKDKKVHETEEKDYLKDVRSILGTLFFKDTLLKQHIIKEDIVRLIKAKHTAYYRSDRGFEQILLDAVKATDEISHKTNDFSLFEELSSIITYFDRYDNVLAMLNHLAFIKNIEFNEDSLRSLIGNKMEFDKLDKNLFKSIFIKDLVENKYTTSYGKRKLKLLFKGIENITNGEASFKDVIKDLKKLTDEEKIYYEIHDALKEMMKGYFPGMEIKELKKQFKNDIAKKLAKKGISDRIPAKLFEKAFIDLRKEYLYLNQIFPAIIYQGNSSLREDFLENSGLDRFYVESLEQEYFKEKGLDMVLLETIREGKEISSIGGGERI